MIKGRLFVGLVDELLAFDAADLRLVDRTDISASQTKVDSCIDVAVDTLECKNYPHVLHSVPGDTSDDILVCGTHSFFPKCTTHERTNLSHWTYLTGNSDTKDEGFSPYFSTRQIVSVLASNGRFFSGTFLSRYKRERTIGMAPGALLGDNTFTVRTPSTDPFWLNDPYFVSAYEVGDYAYFFVQEPAYEVNFGGDVVYSRAMRVCMNDDGTTVGQFRSFQKVRLACSNSLHDEDALPYVFDNLMATYLWIDPDTSEQILYGAFSSPENGPPGAVLCRFTFEENKPNSLTDSFSSNVYRIFDTVSVPPKWTTVTSPTFTCADYTTRLDSYQLLNGVASSPAFHTIAGEEQEFTHLAAARIDLSEEDGSLEIIYYSLMSGDVGQVVMNGSEAFASTIMNVGKPIEHLDIHRSTGIQYLHVVTRDRIVAIARGDCSAYSDCFACFDSKDPYCNWDSSDGSCVTQANSLGFIELFSSTENTVTSQCGARPSTPSPSPTPSSMCHTGSVPSTDDSDSDTQSPTETNSDGCVPSVIPPCSTLPLEHESSTSFSLPEFIGATLGGTGAGILMGIIICAMFFRLFARKKTSAEHSRRRQRRDCENGATTVTTVNNQLDTNAQRKEHMLQGNHSVTQPAPAGQSPPEKDINQFLGDDDDDVLTDLPSMNARHMGNGSGPRTHPEHHVEAPRVLHKPMASSGKVPRGRTESTRWLRASESSDPSESPTLSPVDSPR